MALNLMSLHLMLKPDFLAFMGSQMFLLVVQIKLLLTNDIFLSTELSIPVFTFPEIFLLADRLLSLGASKVFFILDSYIFFFLLQKRSLCWDT